MTENAFAKRKAERSADRGPSGMAWTIDTYLAHLNTQADASGSKRYWRVSVVNGQRTIAPTFGSSSGTDAYWREQHAKKGGKGNA